MWNWYCIIFVSPWVGCRNGYFSITGPEGNSNTSHVFLFFNAGIFILFSRNFIIYITFRKGVLMNWYDFDLFKWFIFYIDSLTICTSSVKPNTLKVFFYSMHFVFIFFYMACTLCRDWQSYHLSFFLIQLRLKSSQVYRTIEPTFVFHFIDDHSRGHGHLVA